VTSFLVLLSHSRVLRRKRRRCGGRRLRRLQCAIHGIHENGLQYLLGPSTRRDCIPNSMCVMFYGPSNSKGRDRDYCWAKEHQLAPFGENLELLQAQNIPKRQRPTAFRDALVESKAGGVLRTSTRPTLNLLLHLLMLQSRFERFFSMTLLPLGGLDWGGRH